MRAQSVPGGVPRVRPPAKPSSGGRTTRDIGDFARVTECASAREMFRTHVSHRALLAGTDMQNSNAVSRSAVKRGLVFESRLREELDGVPYARLRAELERNGVSPTARYTRLSDERLRGDARFERTVNLVLGALREGTELVVDGAVLATYVPDPTPDEPGRRERLDYEADFVLVTRGVVRVIEAKSWPVVDGAPVDPNAAGKALDQAALYVLLLRERIADEALDDPTLTAVVSDEAWLLTPLNVTMNPVVTRYDVARRVEKTASVFGQVVAVRRREGARAPSSTSTGPVGPLAAAVVVSEASRTTPTEPGVSRPVEPELRASIEAFLDAEGTRFDPGACALSCGMSLLCHERAHRAGRVTVLGGGAAGSVPGVATFDRVIELADGAEPTADERGAAEDLVRARRLVDLVRAAVRA